MPQQAAPVTIAMRIPGLWSHPRELIERLPQDCRLTPETFVLPDGTEIDFGAAPADDQFAEIFRSSCRISARDEELEVVDNYRVNVFLSGPGGSLAAARTMMSAAAAMVRAGGAGVFIDNSVLAHGGQAWLEMTDDGSPDAVSFAFVSIIGRRDETYTLGMHVLGLRDIVMKSSEADAEDFGIVDVIRYLAAGEKPVDDGHILADLTGPRFQAFLQDSSHGPSEIPPGSPLHNPFGRLRLVSLRDIAEAN